MSKTMEYTAQVPESKPFTIGSIKNGRWVVYEGKVGIVTEMKKDSAVFNTVDNRGITVHQQLVNPWALVEATWQQIPEIRRPTQEAAYALGYAFETVQ